ncbi:MAG: hypothetical protein H6626_09525 [Pseudobdellovibrionaceae bacterium]|nr:hypothetical protein [Bdellovibrionales bacterium]USN46454.1 MAG: hypothetical protein H6626_09525 [Pseudobdellovibrionaceae bacterium]
MNIKSLTPTVAAVDSATQTATTKEVKTQESFRDRDGNGRKERENQPEGRRLSEEEFVEMIEYLKNLPGVKSSSLSLRVVDTNNMKVVIVEDAAGHIVRRISEIELSILMQQRTVENAPGSLLNKAI